MTVAEFSSEPTTENHSAYDDSIFTTVAPEYSTGEVLTGSTYRRLILNVHDKDVDLETIPTLPALLGAQDGNAELWRILLLEPNGIASPVRGGQRGSTILRQLMPLVPEVARYACVLGKVRNRWYPANLLVQVIGAGLGEIEGKKLIEDLGEALRVSEEDDIFVRSVAQAFNSLNPLPSPLPYTTLTPRPSEVRAFREQKSPLLGLSPAERFCEDLRAVLVLKRELTRRQWMVLIEAILRLGLAMHVLWTCHVNTQCWQLVLRMAAGEPVPEIEDVEQHIWLSHRDAHPLLEVEGDSLAHIRRKIEEYVYARFGLNLLLHRLEDVGCGWSTGTTKRPIGYEPGSSIKAPGAIYELLRHVSEHRTSIDTDPAAWLRTESGKLLDMRPELLDLTKCQSGFTKNLLEFVRHSLGQVETSNSDLKSYDQAYLIANKGKARSRSTMVTQPGPAMLILLTHVCCQAQEDMPASLEDFRSHLADYGLHVPAGELVRGQIGADLEKAGLVVDSPDAAGGRILVRPF